MLRLLTGELDVGEIFGGQTTSARQEVGNTLHGIRITRLEGMVQIAGLFAQEFERLRMALDRASKRSTFR